MQGAGTAGGAVGKLAPTTLEPWGGAPTKRRLEVVGHKGKLNEGNILAKKNQPLSLARQLIWQINLYSRLLQRYFLHLAEKEHVTCLQMFFFR